MSISRSEIGSLVGGRTRHRGRSESLLTRPVVSGTVRGVDVLVVVAAGFLAAWIRWGLEEPEFVDFVRLVHLSGSLLAASIFGFALSYELEELRAPGRSLGRLLAAWSASVGSVLVLLYALKSGEPVSRLWIGYWWLAGLLGLIASRVGVALAIAAAQRAGRLRRAVLVVGGQKPEGGLVARLREAAGDELEIVAALPFPAPADDTLHPLQRYPELAALLRARTIDEVVVGADGASAADVDALLRWLRAFPVAASLAVDGLGPHAPVLALSRIGETPLLRIIEQPLDGWARVVKALEDRLLGTILLVLASPVMACIAIAVKLTSPGPVLYRQLRHGFNQQPIEVLKFRTMYIDRCDAPDARDVRQATRDDPRVTPLGRFLRRTSLDELPQLINVVRGEMSLVGPRPHALAHNDAYAKVIDGYLARHRVKPGITGLAQVNGLRGEVEDEWQMRRRISFDLEYIERWSPFLDIAILLRTLLLLLVDERAF